MTRPFDLDRIGSSLPVADARDALEEAVTSGAFVVTAPPGTGKTTLVPPLVANAAGGRVVVTQPRRIAVRAAARRLAELDGSRIGGRVGFTVRGERRVSDETLVEAVTPGVLLGRLLADPALEGVAAVVLDEVHERSVDSDLLLGMLAEVRTLRDDLVVVAMSATLDASAISALLGDAPAVPVIDVAAPLHPLRIDYAAAGAPRLDARGATRPFLEHVANVAVEAQRVEGCDALVFVPGAREVDAVVRLARERATDVEVLPLHGQLPAHEQDRATAGRATGADPHRIVVSTALAESSLTVPGVRLVVDAGLSREVRRDSARDMTGLVTVGASRASADQRAGRAARQGPGRAVRTYTEAEFAAMPPAAAPEIRSADLVDAALALASWGTPAALGLRLLTAPPRANMESALATLRELGLTGDDDRPTSLGERVARMPVGAREARALLAAGEHGISPTHVAEIVAALSGGHREPGADATRLIDELRAGRARGAARWRAEAKRLARFAGHAHDAPRAAHEAAGIVIALARPDRIARRVSDGSRSYLLAGGTRAAVPEGAGLAGSEWLAVWDVQRTDGPVSEGTGAVIRLAAPLSSDDALQIGAPLRATRRRARIDDGRVRVREEQRLGSIVLSSTPARARDDDVSTAILDDVRARGLDVLPWQQKAAALRARLAFLHREVGAPWPDVSEAALLRDLTEWLAPVLPRGGDPSLARVDVLSALRGMLPWPAASQLDELAPEQLAVPSGSLVRIDYPAPGDDDGRPVVAVKLQEVFGLAATPRLAGGVAPVVFHLLSPARRPLAVTGDLASFWSGPYADVRKEMRGRYPKHPWPEDPWAAPATAKTTRRLLEGR